MKKKHYVFISLVILVFIAVFSFFLVRQIVFYHSSTVVQGETKVENIAELSDRIGIELNPAIDKHRLLIDRLEDIRVYPDTVRLGSREKWEGASSDLERAEMDTGIRICTGSYREEDFVVNVALIYGLHEAEEQMEIVCQVEGKIPGFQQVGEFSRFSWGQRSLFLYTESANLWTEKDLSEGAQFMAEHIPAYMSPFFGGSGKNTISQLWGTGTMTRPYSGVEYMLDFTLGDITLTTSWWSHTNIDVGEISANI